MYVGQGNCYEMVEEFVYCVVMQCYYCVDWVILVDFEVCDCFVGFCDDWFLVGDFCEVVNGVFDDFFVSDCFVKIYVQCDFGDVWYFYD